MKVLTMSALIVALSSGAAFADRHGGGGGGRAVVHESNRGGGGVRVNNTVRENRGGNWGGGVRVHEGNRGWEGGNRGWEGGVRVHESQRYYHSYGIARRPIYNAYSRPYIRERYYDYRYRPSLIVENWEPRYGYVWINGAWNWDGAEWIWTPGYYSPDQAFVEVY